MIVPTVTDVLKNIEYTLENVVKPTIVGTPIHTTVQTMGHLLRHATLRVENEGQMLMDDGKRLRSLLASIHDYLTSVSSEPGCQTCMDSISSTLAQNFRDADTYPTLISMGQEVGSLREALYNALKQLQAMRNTHREEKAYIAIRQEIRDYLALQILDESALVDPAFVGYGPRR
ncbi:MAG: hypothetical protein WDA24_11055 [Tissierellales bacterium]